MKYLLGFWGLSCIKIESFSFNNLKREPIKSEIWGERKKLINKALNVAFSNGLDS